MRERTEETFLDRTLSDHDVDFSLVTQPPRVSGAGPNADRGSLIPASGAGELPFALLIAPAG